MSPSANFDGPSPFDLSAEEAEGLDDVTRPDFADDDGAEQRRWVINRDTRHRIDKFLQNSVKAMSRHQIQKLIALGGVTINGKNPKASTRLKSGDVVDIILPPRPASELKAEPIPLDILYEDEDMIVLNKQLDIIVHPARSQLTGTMLNALAHHFQETGQAAPAERDEADEKAKFVSGLSEVGSGDARPGVVHRLDKNTSGVIVFAKRDESHWLIARQFERRTNLKAYLAVVHGCPDPPGGAIEQPIGKHPTIREAMAVRHDQSAKDALTLYRVRERYNGYSLVEFELKTGRTHQIRVHASYIGHPLVGDLIYGGEMVGLPEITAPPEAVGARPNLTFARPKEEGVKLEGIAAERAASEPLLMGTPALHAALLQIKHPITEKVMTFTAPLHSPMRELVLELRKYPAEGEVVKKGYHVDLCAAVGPE